MSVFLHIHKLCFVVAFIKIKIQPGWLLLVQELVKNLNEVIELPQVCLNSSNVAQGAELQTSYKFKQVQHTTLNQKTLWSISMFQKCKYFGFISPRKQLWQFYVS